MAREGNGIGRNDTRRGYLHQGAVDPATILRTSTFAPINPVVVAQQASERLPVAANGADEREHTAPEHGAGTGTGTGTSRPPTARITPTQLDGHGHRIGGGGDDGSASSWHRGFHEPGTASW